MRIEEGWAKKTARACGRVLGTCTAGAQGGGVGGQGRAASRPQRLAPIAAEKRNRVRGGLEAIQSLQTPAHLRFLAMRRGQRQGAAPDGLWLWGGVPRQWRLIGGRLHEWRRCILAPRCQHRIHSLQLPAPVKVCRLLMQLVSCSSRRCRGLAPGLLGRRLRLRPERGGGSARRGPQDAHGRELTSRCSLCTSRSEVLGGREVDEVFWLASMASCHIPRICRCPN